MRFFLDQDVYALTARFLEGLGHDVLTADAAGLATASDSQILSAAREAGRILVTRDRDFGGIIFVKRMGAGVLYLRIQPALIDSVHQELRQILDLYTEEQLRQAFVTVEPGRHRFRRLPR